VSKDKCIAGRIGFPSVRFFCHFIWIFSGLGFLCCCHLFVINGWSYWAVAMVCPGTDGYLHQQLRRFSQHIKRFPRVCDRHSSQSHLQEGRQVCDGRLDGRWHTCHRSVVKGRADRRKGQFFVRSVVTLYHCCLDVLWLRFLCCCFVFSYVHFCQYQSSDWLRRLSVLYLSRDWLGR